MTHKQLNILLPSKGSQFYNDREVENQIQMASGEAKTN